MTVHQVRQFAVTVAPGTTKAAPLVTPLPLEDFWLLDWVEFEVPPGPRGQAGFYLASSRTPILPAAAPLAPQWLTMNNRMPRYPMDSTVAPGDLTLVSFNIGLRPHTFYVRLSLEMAPDPTPSLLTMPLLAAGSLTGVAGQA